MRNISNSGIAALTQQKGGEPLVVIEVFWDGVHSRIYCDRKFQFENIEGKIVEVSDLDDVVNIAGSSTSQSISVKLSDTDGTIKSIFDNIDIHKKSVNVYQWFSDIAFSDKFLVFRGQINSPIVWNEKERTLSFDIVTQLEDVEIGYSPEEGQYTAIPSDLIGKAWPLPFGTCIRIPALKVDPIPVGVTTDDTGVYDESLDKQILSLNIQASQLEDDAYRLLTLGGADQNLADPSLGALRDALEPGLTSEELKQRSNQEIQQANQLLAQAGKLRQQIAELTVQKAFQLGHEKKTIPVNNASCFPQGTSVSTNLSGVDYNGSMSSSGLNVTSRTRPENQGTLDNNNTPVPFTTSVEVENDGDSETLMPWGFIWVPPGTQVKLTSNLPIRFIAAMLPCSVIQVWAWRTYNSARILTPVPNSYYGVETPNFGAITPTVVTLVKPLSYYNEGWEDDIFVDLTSPVGPNTVDILTWLIGTYSGLAIDPASFATVQAQVDPFPSNFCLFERKNLISALQEIAYQSRCQIWLKNGVFFIRYMPAQPVSVDTITQSDIVFGSLTLEPTATEDVVTKLTASYKVTYDQQKEYKIILRKNVAKYGIHEETDDWYTYTHPALVDLAATFWLIRKSHTWKRLKFKTPLHKLKLETFDYVTMNFSGNYASIGPVVGMVESVQVDTNNLEMSFTVWLPVRLGDMTRYNFAWPVDSEIDVFPGSNDFAGSGGPGQNTDGTLTPTNGASNCGQGITFEPKREHVHDGNPNPGTTDVPKEALLYTTIGPANRTRPRFNYNYKNKKIAKPPVLDFINKTMPAKILSKDKDNTYNVSLYINGLDRLPAEGKAITIDTKTDFSIGAMVFCARLVFDNEKGQKVAVNYIANAAAASVFPAKIISKVSGSTYNVNLYKEGIDGLSIAVKATQLFQDPSDTCPPNTWTLVSEGPTVGGDKTYYMQVPIWLS